MEHRILGNTGIAVSVLGFGSMHLEGTPQPEVNRLLGRVIDSGINLIHVDYNYAGCVEKVGVALRSLDASRRRQVVLVVAGHPPDPVRFRAEFEGAFKRLGLEYIDLFQLAGVSTDERLEQIQLPNGSLEILQQARTEGRIRYIGISSHGDGPLVDRIVRTGQFDSVMTPYNFAGFHLEYGGRVPIPAFRDLDAPLALAHRRGMGVLAIKVLASGLLSETPTAHLAGLLSQPMPVAPAIAIRHVLAKPFVTSAVIGMADERELDENVRAVEDLKPLTPAEAAATQAAVDAIFAQYCVRCRLCLPCPEKIEIPDVFRLEYRAVNYPLAWVRERAAKNWDAMAAKPSACTDCGDCLPRCPYHLPIPALLRAAERKVDAFRAVTVSGDQPVENRLGPPPAFPWS